MLNQNSIAKLEEDDEPNADQQTAQSQIQSNLKTMIGSTEQSKELLDVDDHYLTDDRSGDEEATDSEKEFEEIV